MLFLYRYSVLSFTKFIATISFDAALTPFYLHFMDSFTQRNIYQELTMCQTHKQEERPTNLSIS